MDNYENRNRSYSRSDSLLHEASVSYDGKNYHTVSVKDLSSVGIRYNCAMNRSVGDRVHMELVVHGYLTDLPLKTEATIVWKKLLKGRFSYGARFDPLTDSEKLWIDENVRKSHGIK